VTVDAESNQSIAALLGRPEHDTLQPGSWWQSKPGEFPELDGYLLTPPYEVDGSWRVDLYGGVRAKDLGGEPIVHRQVPVDLLAEGLERRPTLKNVQQLADRLCDSVLTARRAVTASRSAAERAERRAEFQRRMVIFVRAQRVADLLGEGGGALPGVGE
jgi:hypothetical protein